MSRLNEQSMKEMAIRRRIRNLRAQLYEAEAVLTLELERVSLETEQELCSSKSAKSGGPNPGTTDPLVPQIMVHELAKMWAPASYYFKIFSGSSI